ncbi:MAG: ribonuclease HII [Chloroflexota bacterium]
MDQKFPDLRKETALLKQGYCFIAGLDEAGRGAWAGPVVAAAVILPAAQPGLIQQLEGLNDSKKLTPKQREAFFPRIQDIALAVGIGTASPKVIDDVNIVEATRHAMEQALKHLSTSPDHLLLDHLTLPAINLPQDAFPKADRISLTVAAASVIAKVTRDRFMIDLGQQYPEYGFEQHKGYGTQKHKAALADYGPCSSHRLSFQPIKQTIKIPLHPAQ